MSIAGRITVVLAGLLVATALVMGVLPGVQEANAHRLKTPKKDTFYAVGGPEYAKEIAYRNGLKYTFDFTETNNNFSRFKTVVRIRNMTGENISLGCPAATKKLSNYKLRVYHHVPKIYTLHATNVFCTYNKNWSKTLGPGQHILTWAMFRYSPHLGTRVVLVWPGGTTGRVNPYGRVY
jgi:hypothetical protein